MLNNFIYVLFKFFKRCLFSNCCIWPLLQLDAETNKSVDVHFVDDKKTEFSDCSSRARKSLCDYSCKQKQMESGKSFEDMHQKDVTIALLKREIESAIESLKEVQAEMAKLQYEKEKMLMSEKQYEKNMKNLTTEVLTFQAAIDEFQKQSELKIEAITHKVETVEHIVQEAGTYWYETKEVTRSTFLMLYSKNHPLQFILNLDFLSESVF